MERDAVLEHLPTLSVTVLNYNYARFLPECLDSILAQSFKDFEVIVIDDRSSDDSLQVLEGYRRDPRVRVVPHEKNSGFVASLIEGTEVHSRGRYLTVISADDLVRDADAFGRQIALMETNPNAAFCFSGFEKFWSDDHTLIERQLSFEDDRVVPGAEFVRRYLTEMNVQVLHSGTVIRRSAYLAAGGYRRDVRYAVDFSMWPALGLCGDVAFCARPLYGYRVHRGQMSSSFAGVRATLREMLSAIDLACAEATLRGVDTRDLRRMAVRSILAAIALDDAFSGRRRLALTRTIVAFQLRPLDAFFARGLWIVALRTIFGARGFGWTRRLLGRAASSQTAAA
jgi:hypothetical protein